MRIGIVVPVWREEASSLSRALDSVGKGSLPHELVVVGGEPDPKLQACTERFGGTWIISRKGRAEQQNSGVSHLSNECTHLLFLHADTRLPAHWREAMARCIRDGAALGAFSLTFDEPRLRWIQWGGRIRNKLQRTPYGDQCLFMSRKTFEQLGGFRQLALMEDLDLVWRSRKIGAISISSAQAQTSGRRYLATGPARLWVHHTILAILFQLGWRPGLHSTALDDALLKLFKR